MRHGEEKKSAIFNSLFLLKMLDFAFPDAVPAFSCICIIPGEDKTREVAVFPCHMKHLLRFLASENRERKENTKIN